MSRIDKTQVSDAIRLLNALRREAKLADKVVAKLVGKLDRLPQLCNELPSPRYLRQITEAAEEFGSALGRVARARRRLPSLEQLGRTTR